MTLKKNSLKLLLPPYVSDDSIWPSDPAIDPAFLKNLPRIAPFWTDLSAGANGHIVVEYDVKDSGALLRVSWDKNEYFWDNDKTVSFSATLYSENNWIVFSYGDVAATVIQPIFVGLYPGEGTVGLEPVDFSASPINNYGNYVGLYEYFDEDNPFDLQNKILIFKPGSPKYSFSLGTRSMMVDMASLDMVVARVTKDANLLRAVDEGGYIPGAFSNSGDTNGFPVSWSGTYAAGLQTIGADADGNPKTFLDGETLNIINNDGFLAYIVQIEEDRLNQKILDMHGYAAGGSLRNTIFSALETGTIRQRDDLLMRIADAQAGRVLRDQNGNWVRTQQYILRPDEQTVQVLNVSLRGETGPLSGLSTIDARTTFTSALDPKLSLKTLPWGSWMNTRIDGAIGKYVMTTSNAPELDSMSVRFANPANESLKEARFFDDRTSSVNSNGNLFDYHPISSETLTLNDIETFTFSDNPVNGQYTITQNTGDGTNPGGFSYKVTSKGTVTNIPVAFFVVGDGDRPENRGAMPGYDDQSFQDVWDALRVNETGATNIGANNLEIAIDSDGQYFSKPIDVIFIPMSRMLWKTPDAS